MICKPLVAGSIPAAGTIQMKRLLLVLCLVLGGCSVGVTITNAPSSLPDCMGKPGSTGGCR